MPEQLQPAIRVTLILLSPDKPKWRRSRSSAAHRHPEPIVQRRVRHGLRAACNTTRAAKRVAVVELAGGPGALAQSGCVNGARILENRAGNSRAIGDDSARSGAVGLRDAQVFAIVNEAVRGCDRIGDSGASI